MKRTLLTLITLFCFCYSQPGSTENRQLRSEELVLAGVMILEGVTTDSTEYKKDQYIQLLEQSNVTHEQFQQWLTALREDPDSWFETLELIEDYLQ